MFRVFMLLSFVAGFSANDCEFKAKVAQHLLNDGFHRNISYIIEFDSSYNQPLYEDCIVGLDQNLPRGVFANPDELGDLKRLQRLSVIPKQRVNIELPAEQSHKTGVFIITQLNGGVGSTWLPVHARYQHAQRGGGSAGNEIRAPYLYLRCPDRRLEQCPRDPNAIKFYCNAESKEMCNWRYISIPATRPLYFYVPIGDTSAYYVVMVGTTAAVISGTLYLLKALHIYKISERRL